MRRNYFWAALASIVLLAPAASAQQARIVNAKLATRSAAAGLDREYRAVVAAQIAPGWLGYVVPVADGKHQMCCWSNWNDGNTNCCGRCRLDNRPEGGFVSGAISDGRVRLENDFFIVMFRAENHALTKIRTFSQDCEIDAGGLPVTWLTDVNPAQSVALLSSLVRAEQFANSSDGDEERRIGKQAVSAIALHKDPAADTELERFAAPDHPEALRRHVAFWFGSARGERGFRALQRMLREDPSDKVREQAVFGLSVSKVPAALDSMIATAKNDRSTKVRGQALFCLGQKAGKRAVETITEAIEKDPETDIKKKAVFALSQLPKDQGVPMLIQVARTNKNPVVRKQAMFWLGQSNDPRALAFFEEVLKQ